METNDFLADLERQLRGARPRRRPPTAAMLLVPALAVVVALALLRGGAEPEREAAPATPGASVTLMNGTCNASVGEQARERLEDAGYEVTVRVFPKSGSPRDLCATDSSIFGASPEDEQRIGELLNVEAAGGWTAYAPSGNADPGITVILGVNQHEGGIDPIALRFAEGAAAQEAQDRLEESGLILGEVSGPHPPQPTSVIPRDPEDVPLANRARAALGLPVISHPAVATDEQRVEMGLARALVIVGTDWQP